MGGETLLSPNLTEFFRELVQGAMNAQEIRSSEETEFYLVHLLENFAQPRKDWFDRPLALDFLESFRSSATERRAKLRRVADTSLFVTGIFMETLERTLVGPRYYVDLGRLAYGHLASSGGAPAVGPFAELSRRFEEYVQVLSEISFNEIFPSDRRLVRAYGRWLLTGSERDRAWLARQGLVPVPGNERVRH
jgi:hypothetical protein